MSSISSYYYSFRDRLGSGAARRKWAMLALSGRLEDPLVKEFVWHVHEASDGRAVGLTRVGSSGEQQVDLAIVDGDVRLRGTDGGTIRHLVEAKHLRSNHRHRLDAPANDEWSGTLRSLAAQLAYQPGETHGGYCVRLRARTTVLYGLVFLTSTSETNSPERWNAMRDRVCATARELGLAYCDLRRPRIDLVFESRPVRIGRQTLYVTMGSGLWRRMRGVAHRR